MRSIFSEKLSKQDITKIIVSKFKDSDVIKEMLTAQEYFDLDNTEIKNKKIEYFDKNGNAKENPALANNKIPSGFLRMLVEQKQNYAFAKVFSLKLVNDKGEIDTDIDSKEQAYLDVWNDFIKKQLFDLSSRLCGFAVNKGIGWAYVWIDEEGNLKIKDLPSENIYPIWEDGNHEKLDRLVYNYELEVYETTTPENKEYAEYWDKDQTINYEVSDNYSVVEGFKDTEGNPVFSHMIDEDGEGVSWGRIPFIAFKGTDDEMPLLKLIKEGIDGFDKLKSQTVDGLEDDLDPLLVVKGVSPEVNALMETRELAKVTKMIVVDSDGGAEYLQEKTDVEANLKTMQDLRHDIIKFGYGVDFEDARFGGNPNQMVIKSLYQGLDTYTNGIERQFQKFINNVKYFVDKWLEFKGEGSFEELQQINVVIQLDRSMMINQSALIDDTVKLTQTGISKETQLEFNPAVQDVELEKSRLEQEEKENMKKQEELDKQLFGFQNDDKNGNKDDDKEN